MCGVDRGHGGMGEDRVFGGRGKIMTQLFGCHSFRLMFLLSDLSVNA